MSRSTTVICHQKHPRVLFRRITQPTTHFTEDSILSLAFQGKILVTTIYKYTLLKNMINFL